MKPRNKTEREVTALSARLPGITPKQYRYAMIHAVHHIAYTVRKRQVWCSDCGGTIDLAGDIKHGGTIVCPHCRARLVESTSRKRKETGMTYFTTFAVSGGYQVLRHYEIIRRSRKGEASSVKMREVVQAWIDSKGESTIIARPIVLPPNRYCESWAWHTPMTIKRRSSSGYNYYGDRYALYPTAVYPYGGITPLLRRNGFRTALVGKCGGSPETIMRLLLRDNFAEMLVKTRQYELFQDHITSARTECFRMEINICNRNHYYVKDASLWRDYIDMLRLCHKNTHNAYYVCPKNLRAAHDKLLKERRAIAAKQAAALAAERTKKEEARYKKKKGCYFGICFGDDNIVVTVLQSVAAFMSEGAAMHHCVYASGYYERDDALILSARDRTTGKRIETVEVSLKTFDVVQSRGACNQDTPYHDEIIALVLANMGLIRQAKMQRR